MNKLVSFCAICFLCTAAVAGFGQQVDVAIGGGAISAPATINDPNTGTFAESLSGGTYIGFSGDALFVMNGHAGVQGEVFWRASQGSYAGQLPYRPLFWDFNAIYSRRFNKFVGAEALGGIGAESIRFYSSQFTNCDIYGNCSNYVSSNHFMGDVGGGLKLYVYPISLFVPRRASTSFTITWNSVPVGPCVTAFRSVTLSGVHNSRAPQLPDRSARD